VHLHIHVKIRAACQHQIVEDKPEKVASKNSVYVGALKVFCNQLFTH
jgi:hypothetical protein